MSELNKAIEELKILRTEVKEATDIIAELSQIKTVLTEIRELLANSSQEKPIRALQETSIVPKPLQEISKPKIEDDDLTSNNFDEYFYLKTYPDVKTAIASGKIRSGWQHYIMYGRKENRKYRILPSDPTQEFEALKALLESDKWPKAADARYICKKEPSDFIKRAEGIINLIIEEPLQNKRFLDFGCGAGYVSKIAAETKNPTFAVGYDIVRTEDLSWESESNNWLLTTNFAKVAAKGPYDVILLYDVLDHVDSPEELMSKIESLLSPGGSLYIRCHPWCGRHGGHLYHELNKAFVHLIFTDEELTKLGLKPPKVKKVLQPFIEYEKIFQTTKLLMKGQIPVRSTVESFFKDEAVVSNRIERLYKISTTAKWPDFQLSQTFIDYHLEKPK